MFSNVTSNQLISVVEKRCIFFQELIEFLNII
jgi:hypothetical protein